MKLTDRKWKRFNINDIFVIGHGFYNKKPPTSDTGYFPFIGASGVNNGITGFTTIEDVERCSKIGYGANEPIEKKVFQKGYLCVVNNGSAIGYTFYQPADFTCTHDVNPLLLKGRDMNLSLGLFLAQTIRAQGECFAYARKWRPSRMIRSQFLLPINDNGEPDYQFMEDYTRELMNAKRKQYRNYIEKNLNYLNNSLDSIQLHNSSREWKPFFVPELFDEIERGKRLKKADHITGDVPYASSTGDNNGIDAFIEASEGTRVFDNCISLANSGSVGAAFYEPFAFVASDHVTHLKHDGLSKYQYLFLVSLIKQQRSNFNFNREINDQRLNRMRILIPVNELGEPDYAFMEQYGKMLMARKYKQYLDYLENRQ